MPIARKRKMGSDDPPEQVLLKFKSRSIIAAKLQSIKDSTSSNSKYAQKPTKWCPHCNCSLSVKTFKKHKSLYFMQNEWLTTEELSESLLVQLLQVTIHVTSYVVHLAVFVQCKYCITLMMCSPTVQYNVMM